MISMGIGNPRLLVYRELSKPLTEDRRVPCKNQTAKYGNRDSQTIGIQKAYLASDEGHMSPLQEVNGHHLSETAYRSDR